MNTKAFSSVLSVIILFSLTSSVFCQKKNNGFTLTADTPWIISEVQPEPVQRALEDVQKDWYKVFGQRPLILQSLPADWKKGAIYLGLKGSWRERLIKTSLSELESFILELNRDGNGNPVFICTGSDIRGSIFAAYTFSQEILGVDPWYYWTDNEPKPQISIIIGEGYSKKSVKPTFRFRGWFINDEDQLSYNNPDPLKENIISLSMYDKIYETILRLKGNMVCPGTFIMPDERCQELASRRGLILNMHHINTLGLNTFRWPKGLTYSYNKNPEVFEKLWQTCIDAYKNYEVVWTVGYRGKHDRPFWIDEPELNTSEARGEIISRAIAKQVQMIRQKRPHDMIIANMWMEGATLYLSGHIKIPEGVTLVWPDNGAGIIRDNGSVKKGEGVYYHTAMIDRYSNQLTEMVNPNRARREIGRFINADATEFFMLNVSDIRSVPLTTDFLMKMVWDAKPYMARDSKENMDDHILNWAIAQYGETIAREVAPLYNSYFNISYMQDGVFHGEASLFYKIYGIYNQIKNLIPNEKPLSSKVVQECESLFKLATDNIPYVKKLLAKADELLNQIPEKRKDFYKGHLLTQLRIHYYGLVMDKEYCSALLAYNRGDKASALSCAEKGLSSVKTLYRLMHEAEYGKWAGWYGGNNFIYMEQSADLFLVLMGNIKGEATLPVRAFRGYGDIYNYQESHLKNFPLFYPTLL
ncbi:MAG: glycosyl hydrolase 115 family protein [Bacteroidales bacterium]|jgi:hypothetical protein